MADLTSSTVSTTTLKVPITLDDGSKISYNIPDPVSGLSKSDLETPSSATGFAGYVVLENMILKDGAEGTGTGDPYYYETSKIIFD